MDAPPEDFDSLVYPTIWDNCGSLMAIISRSIGPADFRDALRQLYETYEWKSVLHNDFWPLFLAALVERMPELFRDFHLDSRLAKRVNRVKKGWSARAEWMARPRARDALCGLASRAMICGAGATGGEEWDRVTADMQAAWICGVVTELPAGPAESRGWTRLSLFSGAFLPTSGMAESQNSYRPGLNGSGDQALNFMRTHS
jgi:hypothetical protein